MTLGLLLIFLSLAVFLYYAIFVLSTRKGLLSLTPQPPSGKTPLISVVIAARNEQETLGTCLHSVLNQDYPRDRMEIILVDDGSNDKSLAIAEEIKADDSRLRVITMSEPDDHRLSRKPVALARGIRDAKGEIILLTDGDCVVPKTWVRSMANAFDEKTAFVAGPVQELSSSTVISKLSQLEFLGLIGVSAGLIANGTPIICNGANIAFRREAFEAVGGYGESGFCDDEVLMHRINGRGIGSIRYSIDKGSIVATRAPDSLSAFWKQRTRWASKRGHYEDRWILLRLATLYFALALLFFLGVAALFEPAFLPPFLLLFAGKLFVDFLALSTSGRVFSAHIHPMYFGIAGLLHVPYILIAAVVGQFSSLEWKGKQIRG